MPINAIAMTVIEVEEEKSIGRVSTSNHSDGNVSQNEYVSPLSKSFVSTPSINTIRTMLGMVHTTLRDLEIGHSRENGS